MPVAKNSLDFAFVDRADASVTRCDGLVWNDFTFLPLCNDFSTRSGDIRGEFPFFNRIDCDIGGWIVSTVVAIDFSQSGKESAKLTDKFQHC